MVPVPFFPPSELVALSESVAGDPLLGLWTACVANRAGDDFRPASVGDLAGWLAAHAHEFLRWQPPEQAMAGLPASDADAWAECVAGAVQVADVAAQLAATRGEAVAQRSYLLGLLHDAGAWLNRGAGVPLDSASVLPAWLRATDPVSAEAAENVARAWCMMRGANCGPADAEIDVEAARRRAVESRQRWLAPAGGAAGWLPQLAAKIGRLAALETQFQQTLEAEKLASLAEFAAGAGHEINNPLAVISGRAQLFLRDETDPERRRALAMINTQAMRIYEMIADLRLFARPPQIEPQTVDLVQLADRVIGEMAPAAAGQRTVLRRTGQSEPVEVAADATQLTVALRAMCDNALEALGSEGHVEISVCRTAEGAEIRVADDGPGIAPAHRRHLFDPFFSGWQAGRGLGLGLSKCWRIVTNHGGRIDVESSPGRGAVFTIWLPERQRKPSVAEGRGDST